MLSDVTVTVHTAFDTLEWLYSVLDDNGFTKQPTWPTGSVCQWKRERTDDLEDCIDWVKIVRFIQGSSCHVSISITPSL